MNEEIREVTLEELLEGSFSLNEEKLVSSISKRDLEKYTKVREDVVVNYTTNLKVSFYIKKDHLLDSLDNRFTSGNEQVNKKLGSNFKFKDLPNFKSLTFKDFKKIYFDGCMRIINNHKLNREGYFIISESTRMVIPVALLDVEGENRKAFVTSSVFHTAMTNIDVFKWKGRSYDRKDVVVEYRSFDEFSSFILENEGEYFISGVDAPFLSENCLQLFEEGDEVLGEFPIVVIS